MPFKGKWVTSNPMLTPPSPIFLGFRAGHRFFTDYFSRLRDIGVNHIGLNLKYATRPAHEIVQELGEHVVPHFPAHATAHLEEAQDAARS
jgi:hypothetical protein